MIGETQEEGERKEKYAKVRIGRAIYNTTTMSLRIPRSGWSQHEREEYKRIESMVRIEEEVLLIVKYKRITGIKAHGDISSVSATKLH